MRRAGEKVAGVADPEDIKRALYIGFKNYFIPSILDDVPGGKIITGLIEPVDWCIRKALAYYKLNRSNSPESTFASDGLVPEEPSTASCNGDMLDELECVVRHFPNFWLIDNDPSHLYGVLEKNQLAEYCVEVCLPDGFPAVRPQLVIPDAIVVLVGEPELATLAGWNPAMSRLVEVLVELRGMIAARLGLDPEQDASHEGRLVYSHAGTIKEVTTDSFYLSKAGFPKQRERLIERLDALIGAGTGTGKVLLLAAPCMVAFTADPVERRMSMRVEPALPLELGQVEKLAALDFVDEAGDGRVLEWTHDVHQPAEIFTVATMAFKVLVEAFGLKHHERIDIELNR
jgi:hypothetical protein